MTKEQLITEDYAIYNSDCMEVIKDMPNESVDLSVYSPPFASLYTYSSSERDMSNVASTEEFTKQFEYLVEEMSRVTKNGRIKEFPITVTSFLKKKICFFGGGYLRLFPYPMIRHYAKAVNKEGRPVIYYLHPREIDPEHPRLRMGLMRYFKSYVNLNRTMPKLMKLINEQKLTSFNEFIS